MGLSSYQRPLETALKAPKTRNRSRSSASKIQALQGAESPAMTYHHFNRFIDHNSTQLTPSELALALYVCQLIRDKTSLYSESVRRISNHIGLSEATIKRSLKGLEEKGVLKVESSYLSTYAKSYELIVFCPDNCPFIEDHNTKRELAKFGEIATRQLKHAEKGVQIDPPYIELKEEEDVLVSFEGEEELGLLVQLLMDLPETEQLIEISTATHTYPRTLAKVLFEITEKAGLDSSKRKRTYLKEVLQKTPLTLLKKIEDQKALEIGKQLLEGSADRAFTLASSNRDFYIGKATPSRSHEYKRLNTWITQQGFKIDNPNFYINYLATNGLLESKHLTIAEEVLEALKSTKSPIKFNGIDNFEDYFSLGINTEDHSPELVPKTDTWLFHLDRVIEDTEALLPELLTAEELPAYELREIKLAQLKATWLEAHPEGTLSEFNRSLEKGNFTKENPMPITQAQYAKRLLEKINFFIGQLADYHYDKFGRNNSYQVWLNESFTYEDDLNLLLAYIPSRPEGHKKYLAKFAESYEKAIKEFTLIDIKHALYQKLVEAGYDGRDLGSTEFQGTQYTPAPDKYLTQVLEDYRDLLAWRSRAIQD